MLIISACAIYVKFYKCFANAIIELTHGTGNNNLFFTNSFLYMNSQPIRSR